MIIRRLALGFALSAGACTPSAGVIRLQPPSQALLVNLPALYPETLEFDARRDRFLLGSFRQGAVYGVGADGNVSLVVDDSRLCSVLGIAVDGARDRLWAVSSDLGASTKPSAAGPKKLAAVGVYDGSTGKPIHYVDLASLSSADAHLLNGIALDGQGNAYVTDSFAPIIYKIDNTGHPSIFLQDGRFEGPGINLNGLVVHPDGYLLVVKKSDGKLFRVPLDAPQRLSEVRLAAPLDAADGVVLTDPRHLIVIANRTPTANANAAFALTTRDGWVTASLEGTLPLGDVYPTTAVLRAEKLYVVHSKLNQLIQAPPEQKAALRERASIDAIGAVTR